MTPPKSPMELAREWRESLVEVSTMYGVAYEFTDESLAALITADREAAERRAEELAVLNVGLTNQCNTHNRIGAGLEEKLAAAERRVEELTKALQSLADAKWTDDLTREIALKALTPGAK